MNLLDLAETVYASRPDLTREQAEEERTLARAYLSKHAPDLIESRPVSSRGVTKRSH